MLQMDSRIRGRAGREDYEFGQLFGGVLPYRCQRNKTGGN